MQALVVHASDRGSTAELAAWIGEAFAERGIEVEVRACEEVTDLGESQAVVVAGALYLGRWHHEARRFVKQFAEPLRRRTVWLCSTGPLDHSAAQQELPAVSDVTRALQRSRARGHQTFGGKLDAGATGPLTTQVAAQSAGDYRDREQVTAWAQSVADTLIAEAED